MIIRMYVAQCGKSSLSSFYVSTVVKRAGKGGSEKEDLTRSSRELIQISTTVALIIE
jgi:hypothetical protein